MDVLLKALEGAFGPRAAQAIQQNLAQERSDDRAAGRVTLLSSAAILPVSIPARHHTYFGR
jgi:hypothetical protein